MKNYSVPGVYFSENDNVYLPEGAGVSSGLIIGPTEKGPAFLPTKTSSPAAWQSIFGGSTLNQYTALAASKYHAYSNDLYTVRTLGLSNGEDLYEGSTLSVLYSTEVDVNDNNIILCIIGLKNGPLEVIYGTEGEGVDTITINGVSYRPNQLKSKLYNKPNSDIPFLVYIDDKMANKDMEFIKLLPPTNNGVKIAPWFQEETKLSYKNSTSATFKDDEGRELFTFKSIGDGNDTNKDFYITVEDFNKDKTFSVKILDYFDRTKVLELFTAITLDPSSANYIGKVIGDINYEYIPSKNKVIENGNYSQNSSKVYLVIDTYVEEGLAFDNGSYPYSTIMKNISINIDPAFTNSEYNNIGVIDNKDTDSFRQAVNDQRWSFSNVPEDINIINSPLGVSYNTSNNFGSAINFKNEEQVKLFGLGTSMHGGYNATSPYITMSPNNMQYVGGFDMTKSSTTLAYNQALALVQDRNIYDVNLLTLPGVITTIGQGSNILAGVLNWINNDQRQDVFYIQDQVALTGSAKNNAESSISNSSYTAAYHAWGKLNDGGKGRWCPPSVDLMGVYAFSDNVSGAQAAPAGLSRGGVTFTKLYDYISSSEKKLLLDNQVNPIVKLGSEGIFVMGNLTQLKDGTKALSRINVRRLIISMKKEILGFSKYYMYEQPQISLFNRWENQIKSVLDNAVENGGITKDYKVVISTAEADVLRGIMRGSIYIKPLRSIEYVILEFNLEGPDVDFSETE